jgi:two-component system, LytTR family, response regulator
MEKIKILIVEDELMIATHLKLILEDLGYAPYEPIGNKTEALAFLKTAKPDIAILDINLQGNHDGIEIGKYISDNCSFPFIFLTSNSDKATVSVAKESKPVAYLIKPFTEDEIFAAIEVAMRNHQSVQTDATEEKLSVFNNCIFIKQNNRFLKIPFDQITYIEVDDKYVEVYMQDGAKHLVRSSMDTILDHLKNFAFMRIHRSYAVNLNYLKEINGDVVVIHNKEIPIGRVFRDELLKKITTV